MTVSLSNEIWSERLFRQSPPSLALRDPEDTGIQYGGRDGVPSMTQAKISNPLS